MSNDKFKDDMAKELMDFIVDQLIKTQDYVVEHKKHLDKLSMYEIAQSIVNKVESTRQLLAFFDLKDLIDKTKS